MATAAAAATTIEIIPAWLQEICQRLGRQDDSLTHLNLNIRRLNDGTMMHALAAAVCQSPHLLVLNLTSSLVVNNNNNNHSANSSIGGDRKNVALEQLVQHVIPHQNSSLQVLHLSYNHLGDVMSMGQALQTNQNLIELHLSYNRITAESAAYIAQGIQVNQTLQVLNLNCNEIGDGGAVQLAQALKRSSSSNNKNKTTRSRLRHLGLERNGIQQTGAHALQDALITNFTLHECGLGKNVGVSAAQESGILTLCRANQAGRGLLMVGDDDDDATKTALLPLVLGRAQNDPNVLLSLLTSCADMLTAVVVNNPPLQYQHRQHDGSSSSKRARLHI